MNFPEDSVVSREGATEIVIPSVHSVHGPGKRIGRVFFNGQMAFNRDVSVMFMASSTESRSMLDAMAGTGVRSARIAHEARPDLEIAANDKDPESCVYIDANSELNNANIDSIADDLRRTLAKRVFDYVDLDPFGSPVHFIPSVIQGLKRHGIAGITATDTAPLAGTYPKKCIRRYGAVSARSPFGHETGLRILIGHIVKEAAKEDRGLECVLSFYADHYLRTFVRMTEGGSEADKALAQLGYIDYDPLTARRTVSEERSSKKSIGPLWTGPIHDKEFLGRMEADENLETRNRCSKYLDLWRNELDMPYFYENDELASLLKRSPHRMDDLLEALNDAGKCSKTHFSPTGFKTDLELEELTDIYSRL